MWKEAGDGAGRAMWEGACEGLGLSQDPKKRNVFWVVDTGVNVENGPEGRIEAGGR